MVSKLKNKINSPALYFWAVPALLLCFLVVSFFSVLGKSITYDEPWHYKYGVNILNGDSTRFDDSKMPFSVLNALPAKIASFMPDGELRQALEKMVVARLMTILFSLIVAWVVFYWSYKLYGVVPGLISLGLYVFDPNIIAHSQLITTDIYGVGTILFSSYWLWKFAHTRKWQDGLVFSVMLGLAQLAKYTSASLYPLFAVTLIIYDIPQWRHRFAAKGWTGLASEPRKYFKYIFVTIFVSIVIINAGFLFNRSFTYLEAYQFYSNFFQSIQSHFNFPIPTPYPYLEGLDLVMNKERTGLGFIYIYLFGMTRFGEGFPGYYFAASLLKVPTVTQLIIWASLIVYFKDEKRRRTFWRDEWFLLWLVLFYAVYFNFFYKAQIGIRYYLVIFPLLYVFAGGLFKKWNTFTVIQRNTTVALFLYLIVSVLSYYPNYLAYFNELIPDHKDAYKYLADSNLDWGQDEYVLKEYLQNHGGVFKVPDSPVPLTETTVYYISINRLVGVINGPENYRWLRENFEPFDTIGSSYLLYEITPKQMQSLCETTDFCNKNIRRTKWKSNLEIERSD